MFKKMLIFFFVMGLSRLCLASEWTGHHQVKKLYPHGSIQGIFVQLEATTINPDNCGAVDWYFLGPDNSMQKEIYSLILAAKKSKYPVSLFIQGCAQGRPSIVAAIED